MSQEGNENFNAASETETFEVTLVEEALGLAPDKLQVRMYPNPAIDFLRIEVESAAHFRLMDLKGGTLLKGVVTDEQINVSEIPAGIYLMEIETPDGVLKKKLMKAN
ncbi:MAG: hypothetical protein Tsb0034_23150 [Ekhidna sp.]